VIEHISPRERQQTLKVAEEYRNKGYTVTIGPKAEQLPEFLSGYRPGLLVKKGKNARIVEVATHSSLAKDSRVKDLARILEKKPGWRFDLVLVSEEEKVDAPEDAVSLARDEILQRLQESERLLDAGAVEAAILTAWATSEAAVRLLITEEGIALDRPLSEVVIKQAVMNGVISREEYDFLERARKYRNALAHGYKVSDLDPMLAKEIIQTTKHILEDQPPV
jgi:uncharacterized protein YutE (UPF0331/DUF86 family)